MIIYKWAECISIKETRTHNEEKKIYNNINNLHFIVTKNRWKEKWRKKKKVWILCYLCEVWDTPEIANRTNRMGAPVNKMCKRNMVIDDNLDKKYYFMN